MIPQRRKRKFIKLIFFILFIILIFSNIISCNRIDDLKMVLAKTNIELVDLKNIHNEYKLKGIIPEQLTQREMDIIICAFAEAFELEPETVKTIIHIESSWNPKAKSSADCRGLMQLHPLTALKKYGIKKNQLYNPWINIRLGCDYFNCLQKQFKNRDRALIAYNSGPTNARKVKYPDRNKYVQKFNETLPIYQ